MVIRARKPKRKEKSAVRPEYRTLSDGVLDLAYFAGELLPNPDKILVSLGGDLRNYAKLLRDDTAHRARFLLPWALHGSSALPCGPVHVWCRAAQQFCA